MCQHYARRDEGDTTPPPLARVDDPNKHTHAILLPRARHGRCYAAGRNYTIWAKSIFFATAARAPPLTNMLMCYCVVRTVPRRIGKQQEKEKKTPYNSCT